MTAERTGVPVRSRTKDSAGGNPQERPAPGTQRGRIEFLDVLRGFAALLVILQHSVEAGSPRFALWTNKYINFGEVGVVVFFIVSGFIIPVSLEKYNSLPQFWLGRVLRLWPTYIASMIGAIAIHPFAHELPAYFKAHPTRFILGNLTMFAEYLRIPLALGAYWTLSLELVFYLLCSLLFLIGSLRKTKLWLAVSALSLLLAQSGIALAFHKSLPAGRIGLLVTALFGTLLFRELSPRSSRTTIGVAMAGIFASFAVCFWIRFDLYPPIGPGVSTTLRPNAAGTIASWICAYLVFLLIFSLRSRAFPRIFLWIGQISYPLYLFHGLVLAMVPKHLPSPVLLMLVLAPSLALAHLVHILIEQPVGRFQHKLLPHRAVTLRA
jgi:peptidoglycan/LPS O-acetylase OafA/YrhL